MSRKTSKFRKMFRIKSRNKSRTNRLSPLAGLLAAGLSLSRNRRGSICPYPTYSPARSRTAPGSSAVARSSTQPAPKSTSASGFALRPLR